MALHRYSCSNGHLVTLWVPVDRRNDALSCGYRPVYDNKEGGENLCGKALQAIGPYDEGEK